MKIVLIDNGSIHYRALKNLFSEYPIIEFKYNEIDKKCINSDDVVILSGGPGMPFPEQAANFKKEINLVLGNHTGPIFGVCLGFQLISFCFGSEIRELANKRRGLVKIKPNDEGKKYFSKDSYLVSEAHSFFINNAKYPLIPLATSDDCIEIIKHSSRPIFGTQFHPEILESQDGKDIMFKLLKPYLNK